MNPTRDEILRMLMVMMLRHPDSQSDIQVLNLLKYDQPFELTDDLQIPYMGQVKALIADGGSSTLYRSFTIPESDIVDGMVSLVGRTNDQGDTVIPSKPVWSVYTNDGSIGRYDYRTNVIDGLGTGDIEVVLVGVEGDEPIFLAQTIDSSGTNSFKINENFTVTPESESLIIYSASIGKYYNSSSETEGDGSQILSEGFPFDQNIFELIGQPSGNATISITNTPIYTT